MKDEIERKKRIGKIGTLIVVAMFSMLILAQPATADPDTELNVPGTYIIDIDWNSNDPASNFIVKHEDGPELFRAQENGNFGIGTTSPDNLLDIEKQGTAKSNLDIFHITNTVNAADMDGTETSILFNQYYFGATPQEVNAGRITVGTETDWGMAVSYWDGYMAFHTVKDGSVSEKVRITSDGKVGIGTTNPGAKLNVSTGFNPQYGAAAIGYSCSATGGFAIAMGYATTASGTPSTAMGRETTASGAWGSTAMGYATTASGNSAIAMGDRTGASGDYSTSMGSLTTASGSSSTAMGSLTTASGSSSTAMGYDTTASGGSSTAMGYGTEANGPYSTAMGVETIANGNVSTAMGCGIIASGNLSFGIGLDVSTRTITQDNTMAIMGGKVGIGTVSPDKLLHLGDDTENINGEIRFESSDGDLVDLGITTNSQFYITGGNVGIGTNNPQRPLHISDVMRLEPRSSAPSPAFQGDIYMHDGTGTPAYPVLRVYDGTVWKECW